MQFLRALTPPASNAPRAERLRAALGAVLGLTFTALLSFAFYGRSMAAVYFIAPMGASAVLLFCLPASPLAQPYPVVAGNVVSALVGIACAKLMGAHILAAPLAGGLAIAAMFALRCLHPPGGSVALMAVLGQASWSFALLPVALNSVLLVLGALIYQRLTGRRPAAPAQTNIHATDDAAPTARLGFTPEDLDAVLLRHGQVLDISRADLESLFLQTEAQAYSRRFGVIACRDIMSVDVVTLAFSSTLEEAWGLMRKHQVHALPVLNRARRVIGIVSQSDFLRHHELDEYRSMPERLRQLIRRSLQTHGDKPEVVGQIMSTQVQCARFDQPIVELVAVMANRGLHHLPVVDEQARFAGMLTQSDVLAALYESRLA